LPGDFIGNFRAAPPERGGIEADAFRQTVAAVPASDLTAEDMMPPRAEAPADVSHNRCQARETCFFQRARAAQRGVAPLRIAAEALNNRAVPARITIIAAAALDQQPVIVQRFAVHERHVEEIKLRAVQRPVEAFSDSFLGERERQMPIAGAIQLT